MKSRSMVQTNILGSRWDDPANRPTLEKSNDLAAVSVTPLRKTLRFDTARDLKDAPAKIEGMAFLADGTLLLINDNDFGIRGDETKIILIRGAVDGPIRPSTASDRVAAKIGLARLSVFLRDVEVGRDHAALVVGVELALRQRDRIVRHLAVGDLRQQVRDAIQARAPSCRCLRRCSRGLPDVRPLEQLLLARV